MQIPAELEKDAAAAKTIVIADEVALAADARVLADKVSVLAFIASHKGQMVGAIVIVLTVVAVFILAGK
jgi:hypothetical protein